MDSLLLLGPKDERLERLLVKLGYELEVGNGETSVSPLLTKKLVDLIILDARIETADIDLFEYIRTDEITKQIPVIMLGATTDQRSKAQKLGIEKLEFVEAGCSPGSLAGKIATQLRLRKMKGAEAESASLAEINAALRDLNSRMQKEVEEARQIQESLLPEHLPQDPRVDLAVSYDPLEDVGGDWYFVQREKSGKFSLMIADVTGHGLAAAFIGSMTKLAHTAAHQEDPGSLLTGMNRLMTPQLPPGRFVTMSSVLFDPETGKIQATSAGHPPCLIVSPSKKEVKKIGSKGFALGFLDDSEFSTEEAIVEPGDTVVLLTDGITEAQNRTNEMFGTDRLGEVVMANGAKSAKEIISAALNALHKFCDGRILKDDVTLLVLKRKS